MRYFTNELSFDIPPFEARDETLHLFEVSGAAIGLVVARAELGGRSLADALEQHMSREASTLERFELLERTTGVVGGLAACEVADRFRLGGALLYKRSLHFAYHDTWVQVAASGPFSERTACDAQIRNFVATVRPRPC